MSTKAIVLDSDVPNYDRPRLGQLRVKILSNGTLPYGGAVMSFKRQAAYTGTMVGGTFNTGDSSSNTVINFPGNAVREPLYVTMQNKNGYYFANPKSSLTEMGWDTLPFWSYTSATNPNHPRAEVEMWEIPGSVYQIIQGSGVCVFTGKTSDTKNTLKTITMGGGSCELVGDISYLLHDNIINLNLNSTSTVTGSINTVPARLKTLILSSLPSVKISDISILSNCDAVSLSLGTSPVIYSQRKTFPSTMSRFEIYNPITNTDHIDNLLIDLSNVSTWINQKVIRLYGNRSANSDAALNTLVGKGVTVAITNI